MVVVVDVVVFSSLIRIFKGCPRKYDLILIKLNTILSYIINFFLNILINSESSRPSLQSL